MPVISSVNPATLEISGEVETTDPSTVENIVSECREVQKTWSDAPKSVKLECLRKLRMKLIDESDRIAGVIHGDTGKPRAECYSTEILSSTVMVSYCEKLLRKFKFREKVNQGPMSLMCAFMGRKSYIEYVPYGVIGVISPYNFPLALPFTEIVMAVAAGNGVVLKPSSETPMTGHLIEELFEECGFPKGLVRAMSGPGIGTAIASSGVDKIVFTGGSDTGIDVMKTASERLTPVILELGGKDAMVVLDDADIPRCANCAVWASFVNSGQVCVSVKRIYVQNKVYDQFVSLFTERVKTLKQGNGWNDPDVSVGPMINERELERMEKICSEIVAEGGKIVTGGKRNPDLKGYFFEPTVVTGLPKDSYIINKEIFGPVVCIFPFDTDEEGLALANGCDFALAGSVWTKDVERGRKLASKMLSGTIDVNNAVYTYGLPATPWGGQRMSGIGTTHSEEGFRQLLRPHHVHVDKGKSRRDPWWMPYSQDDCGLLSDISDAFFGRHRGMLSCVGRFLRTRKRE